MPSDEINDLSQHARRGFTASLVRQMIVQSVGIVTMIVLSRVLAPADFAFYGASLFLAQLVSLVTDTGLGLVLMRQKEAPSREVLATVCTFQVSLATVICAMALSTTPLLRLVWPALRDAPSGLLWCLLGGAWLGAFRTVPLILLERRLAFTRLALVELVENLSFNAVALAGACLGWGATLFGWAVLARVMTGLTLLHVFAGGPPRLTAQWTGLRPVLRTGLGFQGMAIGFFVKDLALPAFIMSLLGTAQFGYFIWARDLLLKMVTFSRLYSRIALPTLARLQDNTERTARALRQSSLLLAMVHGPVAVIVLALPPLFIPHVFGEHWWPAVPVLAWFMMVLVAQNWWAPWFALMQSLGSPRPLLRLLAIAAPLEIATSWVLVRWGSLPGAGAALALHAMVLVGLMSREVRQKLGKHFAMASYFNPGLLAVNAVAAALFIAAWPWLPRDVTALAAISLVFACIVVVLNAALFREERQFVIRNVSALRHHRRRPTSAPPTP